MASIYRDGAVHVTKEQCDACAFSPQRIIPGSRVAAIVRDTKDDPGASFICHKTTIAGGGKEDAVCKGWFDRFAEDDPVFITARAFDLLKFVEVPHDGQDH